MDEKDWRSAKMMFGKILDIAPPYVIYEAAEAFIADKSPDYALDLYDRLDQTSVRAMRGRVSAYMIIGSENDIMSSIQDFLDSEFAGTQDYSDIISMLLASGHSDEARKVLDRMGRSNKRDPAYLISNAKVLLDRGDVPGAGRSSREAVRYAKRDPSVRALAARIRFVSGFPKLAEKECDRILTEFPKNRDALVLKKDLLIANGDTKGALDICKTLLDDEPDDIPTMLTLSSAMNIEGDSNGALMTLRNVLRLDPRAENAISVVETMITNGFYREAMFLCNDLEKSLPPNPMIRRLKGNAEYCMGDYIKASASYASAAELAPHDAVIWHSKGMADEARGDLESAEIAYNRAVLLDLGRSEYWISKSIVQENAGDPYGAVESLNRAIDLDPTSINPLVRKAAILEKVGRYRDALHFIEICAVREPANEDIALMRVRVLRESGSTEEALRRARQIHEATHSEGAILELASCLAVYGQRFDAIRVIEAGLDSQYEKSDRLRMALDSLEEGSEDLVADSIVHEEIVLPDEDEAKVLESAEAAFSIAESMRGMGDYKGAVRNIDRAMSIGGEKSKYVCLKAGILLDMGNNKEAHDLLTDFIRNDPKNPLYHEAMGDVRMGRSEYRGALQEYEKAISLGLAIPILFIKKGDAQQGLGYYDRAIDSYTTAVNRDPDNSAYRLMLANKLYDREYLSRAEAQLVELLETSPTDAEAMILLARTRRDARKDAGVTEVYRMFKALDVDDAGQRDRMIEVLVSAGHEDEANSLRKTEPVAVVDTKVKRSAEKILRRAFVSKSSPLDEDLLLSSGFEGPEAQAIMDYIEKTVAFGEITPGTPEFQKMERLSNEIILKIGWKDLETNPDLPLETVFVKGEFKDVDQAKRFCAYVKKAMRVEVQRDDNLKIVLERVQGKSAYDIMKSCKVGVYQARQIKLILGAQ